MPILQCETFFLMIDWLESWDSINEKKNAFQEIWSTGNL